MLVWSWEKERVTKSKATLFVESKFSDCCTRSNQICVHQRNKPSRVAMFNHPKLAHSSYAHYQYIGGLYRILGSLLRTTSPPHCRKRASHHKAKAISQPRTDSRPIECIAVRRNRFDKVYRLYWVELHLGIVRLLNNLFPCLLKVLWHDNITILTHGLQTCRLADTGQSRRSKACLDVRRSLPSRLLDSSSSCRRWSGR